MLQIFIYFAQCIQRRGFTEVPHYFLEPEAKTPPGQNIKAILENLQSEINYGLLTTLENRAAGEIFGDMISMAKKLFEEGRKESSSVLASGALEDSMKKFAIQNGLDVYDSELSQVVNALKSGGHLKGPQASLIHSFVTLRNKAFHAQFDKIEMPEIISLISFVEQFLIQNFK